MKTGLVFLILVSLVPLNHFTEISRARHLQSPPPDAEERRAAAPHAEESALQSQVEQTAPIHIHDVVVVNSFGLPFASGHLRITSDLSW